MSILNNETRSASAKVDEEAKVIIIDKPMFYSMIRNNAEFAISMLQRMSERLRRATDQIEEAETEEKIKNTEKRQQ